MAYLISTYYFLLNIINFVLPKTTRRITIITYPDFDDQCRAIIESNKNHEIFVLVDSSSAQLPTYFRGYAKVLKKNSILGIIALSTSRAVLLTHGLNSRFKLLAEKRQVVVNLTHGMYLKKMHLMLDQTPPPAFHYILSSSSLHKKVLSQIFGVIEDKVLVKGLPRNKYLLQDTNCNWLHQIKKRYEKIHIWLPTYRKATGTYSRIDADSLNLFGSDSIDISHLNNLLHERNEYLIVKPHPMADYSKEVNSLSNIKILENEDIEQLGCSLYELLSISDTLWTDYSSVFIDYMATGKAILFILFDFEQYKSKRGFVFELNLFPLPGKIIIDCEGLYSHIEKGVFNSNYELKPYLDKPVYDTLLDEIDNFGE